VGVGGVPPGRVHRRPLDVQALAQYLQAVADVTVHCCAFVPLQVYTWIRLELAVLAPRSSRHKPSYPAIGPVAPEPPAPLPVISLKIDECR